MGYVLVPTQVGGLPSFELAGYSPAMLEAFSTRRRDILNYMADKGWDYSAKGAQAATLHTRKRKDEPAKGELSAMWKARADALGLARDADKVRLDRTERGLDAPAGALHAAGSGLAGGRPPGGASRGVQRIRPSGGGSGPRARAAHACRFAGRDRAAARGRPSGRRRRRRADDAAHAQGREGGGPAHAGGEGHGTASRSRRGGRRTARRHGAD